MGALHKNEMNKHKLKPLGIPSGIRRITAAAILYIYKSRFLNHLLHFNYAFGKYGGVDLVASEICLGFEEYITKPEREGKLSTRVLTGVLLRSYIYDHFLNNSTVPMIGGPAHTLRIFQTLIHSCIFSGMVHLGD